MAPQSTIFVNQFSDFGSAAPEVWGITHIIAGLLTKSKQDLDA